MDKAVKENELKLLIVDYLQLVAGERGGNRTQEVGSVSKALRQLALKYNIAVVALAQLSRAAADETDPPPPQLTHLREAGDIGQDASGVIFIHRPEYYRSDNRPGEADIIFAKQREGSPGTVTLGWQGEFSRFDELKGGISEFDNQPF